MLVLDGFMSKIQSIQVNCCLANLFGQRNQSDLYFYQVAHCKKIISYYIFCCSWRNHHKMLLHVHWQKVST